MGEQRLAAIVLAAGSSSRMGQPKQLIEIEGEPLIRRAARLALGTGADPVIVALGAHAAACRAALNGLELCIVENAEYAQGMGRSLALAMEMLAHAETPVDRVLVTVCDQPLVTPAHLRSLLELSGSPAAAAYSGRIGVPAVFGREHFAALAGAEGDEGMRGLLRAHSAKVARLPLPEAAVDLDTPEDLLHLKAAL